METINLPDLPRNWDALSAEQMVELNRIRHEHGQSKESFLFHSFCYLMGMEVKAETTEENQETLYLFRKEGVDNDIAMTAWEVQFFVNEKLKWLTEDCTRLMDVFPTLILRGKTFVSPDYAMAGMTYQQYKKAQDYIVYYNRLTQKLVSMLKQLETGKVKPEEVQKRIEERKQILGKFLAAVYTPETLVTQRIVDGQTVVCDPPEKTSVFSVRQIEIYGPWFEELPEEQAEAVMQLFAGTMLNYRKMFPLLFPDKPDNQGQSMNFIQVESSTMNALQSKLNFNNYQTIYDSNAPFILERLHSIIKEGKALDEQHRKMKSKRK